MTLRIFTLATSSVLSLTLGGLASVSNASSADEAPSFKEFGGERPFELERDSLIISSSTYDPRKGALSTLTVGTTLPNSATATTSAVAGNSYVSVWNNATVDGSFGATSPIELSDVDPLNGRVLHRIRVPEEAVVTSFSSKSELGLHIAKDWRGSRVIFMGYAGAGVGALDVSNSDAVPGQDPTNPVTFAFGTSYAFPRTIVSMDEHGHFAYTPTVDYGGNNGRSALLAPNGLFYAVGNANNGNATTYGSSNGTNPDVTETTGLEVVNPLDEFWPSQWVPPSNSAEVDPLLQFTFTTKPDKPGKDDNYRGVTEYGGALYFTKGSGSNGVDTVYSVDSLPTLANAASTKINIVPGFPTDSAKETGGDFTPFAVFFANATTMYVADEGSGNATDVASHAGLEKWSLNDGVWTLDYVLNKGLIGNVDSNLNGYDGPYPDVTTVGLRNLTGVVHPDGTVTLWATTSTSSASGDAGADPNQVVRITDRLAATSLTGSVAEESFTTIAGPTYGKVYRGVAFAD
jgi:hypothetical protein